MLRATPRDMLRLFGPDCAAAPVEAGEIAALPESAIWIDMLEPTREEEALAEKLLGSNIPTRQEMMEIEPSSRLYQRKGSAYMTMSVLSDTEDGQRGCNDPVTFILSEKHLVTVRYIDPKPFVVFADHLYGDPELASDSRTLFVRLLDAVIDQLADEFEECGSEVDAISRRIFGEHAHRRRRDGELRLEAMLMRIGKAQQWLATLREGAVSAIRLLTFFESTDMMEKDSNRRHVESLVADAKALSDHSNFLGDNLTFLLDASLGLISLEQNDVMKVFSVVAVVLMPPTLIAGIYGMNFDHMPELKHALGYPMSLVAMLASAVLPFWWARKKGWL